MLTLTDIAFRRGRKPILSDITFSLRSGQCLAVIGPNGAGKSTLLAIASGNLQPSKGSVTHSGQNIATVNTDDLACRRAILLQTQMTNVIFSVEEVVRFGRYPHARHETKAERDIRVEEAMDLCDLETLAKRPCRDLSGGELQRVHAARVIAQVLGTKEEMAKRILLLDEPNNNLDLSHQASLLSNVRALSARGIAVLAILHDINLAGAFADDLLLLDNGRVLDHGSPQKVLSAANLERAYVSGFQSHRLADGRHVILPDIKNEAAISAAP